jgi:hypothetical protein
MRKFYRVLCVVTLSIFTLSIYAQKEIIKVTPDYKIGQSGAGTVGNLNDTIAYVAANQGCGNVIFELERDAFYYSINEIQPDQQDLHVRAEEGDGRRPIVMAAANPDDGSFNQIFYEFTGNMTLEGLHILGVTTEGSQLDQALRTDAENLRVIVNDCIIEKYRDRALRMNNAGTKAYFTNSIIRNMGEQESGGVFIRVNTYCDTLVVQNCTLYNLNNYLFQNTRNGLNYFEVTNNTFMNWATSDNRGVDVGRAKEVLIADNVFYNGAFNRNNTTHDPFFVANDMTDSELPWEDSERDIQILNNNWYVDDEVAGIYDKYYDAARDTLTREIEVIVGEDTTYQEIPYKYIVGDVWIMDETLDTLYDGTPALAALMDMGVVTFENNFREELSFTNPPDYPELHVMVKLQYNWDDDLFEPILENISLDSDTMYWVTEDAENPFDFGYNDDAISATAGIDGGQIGADWELYDANVGIRNTVANENRISLYPNPTSSFLNIENDYQSLEIFDMTGKLVYQARDNAFKVLNVSNLGEGLYIIAITDMDNHKLVDKFVKK